MKTSHEWMKENEARSSQRKKLRANAKLRAGFEALSKNDFRKNSDQLTHFSGAVAKIREITASAQNFTQFIKTRQIIDATKRKLKISNTLFYV